MHVDELDCREQLAAPFRLLLRDKTQAFALAQLAEK